MEENLEKEKTVKEKQKKIENLMIRTNIEMNRKDKDREDWKVVKRKERKNDKSLKKNFFYRPKI